MFKWLSLFLVCVSSVMGETNYVYYSIGDNRPQFATNSCVYDFERDAVIVGGYTLGGIDWSVIRVAMFYEPIPHPFTNVSQVTSEIILPTSDWKYSIRRTVEWNDLTNSIAAYPTLRDEAAVDIAQVTDAKTKTSLNDLKAMCNQLQDEIQKLRRLLGKNMQVEP